MMPDAIEIDPRAITEKSRFQRGAGLYRSFQDRVRLRRPAQPVVGGGGALAGTGSPGLWVLLLVGELSIVAVDLVDFGRWVD